MLGSWIIRTPRGRYLAMLRQEDTTAEVVVESEELGDVWFYARDELATGRAAALEVASELLARLGCLSSYGLRSRRDRAAWPSVAELHAAVLDGVLVFLRLPDSHDLRSVFDDGPARPSIEPAKPRHWIELEIVDDDTGLPMAGMVVALKFTDGFSAELVTDGEGRIYVDGQPAGAWEIVDVRAPVEVAGFAQISSERSGR